MAVHASLLCPSDWAEVTPHWEDGFGNGHAHRGPRLSASLSNAMVSEASNTPHADELYESWIGPGSERKCIFNPSRDGVDTIAQHFKEKQPSAPGPPEELFDIRAGDLCSICYEDQGTDEHWAINCAHHCHETCIYETMLRSILCPKCRRPTEIARVYITPSWQPEETAPANKVDINAFPRVLCLISLRCICRW